MVQSRIVATVIGILFIVITLLVYTNVFSYFDGAHAKCKSSVYATSLSPGGNPIFKEGEINCPIRFKDFRGDARREIANEMYHCWDNYGEGTLSLFSEVKGTYCAPCTIFTLNKDQDDFTQFLYEEKYKPDTFSFTKVEKVEYMKFLAAKTSDEFDPDYNQFKDQKIPNELKKENDYIIMLYYVKGETELQEFARFVENYGGIGGGTATAAGAILFIGSNPLGWTIALGGFSYGVCFSLTET